jgi:hypothetical protein
MYHEKSIAIDRRAPYLIRGITYRDRGGHCVVRAHLSDYEQVEGSEVLAPRHIFIEWPESGNSLDLTVRSMKRWEKPVDRVFKESPLQAERSGLGEVIRVDRPAIVPTTRPTTLPE